MCGMKNLLLTFLSITPLISSGQYQYGTLQEHFFGREPSARAEAMGKAYASISGDIASTHYNPAGLAGIEGLETNISYNPSKYYRVPGYQTFFGAGYKVNRYLQFAFSQYHFDFGDLPIQYIFHRPYSERNALSISSEPLKDLYIGANANYFVSQFGFKPASCFYADLGVIKKFRFGSGEDRILSIGASVTNLNNGRLIISPANMYVKEPVGMYLPSLGRAGVNYSLHINKGWLNDTLKTLQVLVTADVQRTLNSNFGQSAFRSGCEFTLFEVLALRGGYYYQDVHDYGFSENYSSIAQLTYGAGLLLPLNKLTSIPLRISFDYTNLPLPDHSKVYTNWGNSQTFTLRLNWIHGKA